MIFQAAIVPRTRWSNTRWSEEVLPDSELVWPSEFLRESKQFRDLFA